MRSLVGHQSNMTDFPGKRGNEGTDMQWKTMWKKGKDRHLQARERCLRRDQLGRHFHLRFLASRTVRKLISGVQGTQSVVLYYGRLGKWIHPAP